MPNDTRARLSQSGGRGWGRQLIEVCMNCALQTPEFVDWRRDLHQLVFGRGQPDRREGAQ